MLCHWSIFNYRPHLRSYAHILDAHQRRMFWSKTSCPRMLFAYLDALPFWEGMVLVQDPASKWSQLHTNTTWSFKIPTCVFVHFQCPWQARDSTPAYEHVIWPIWSALLHEHLDWHGRQIYMCESMVVSVEHTDIDGFGCIVFPLGCDWDIYHLFTHVYSSPTTLLGCARKECRECSFIRLGSCLPRQVPKVATSPMRHGNRSC